MSRNIPSIIITISIFLLTACQQDNDQSLEGQSKNHNSPLPLSTTDKHDETLQDSDPLKKQEQEEIHIPDYNPPGFGVPQEEPAKQSDTEKQLTSDPDQTVESAKFHLPFQDFQDRWNAVSREQGSDLQIAAFDLISSDEDSYYQCLFDHHLVLRVFTSNQYVRSIQMLNKSSSSSDLIDMLTGWSHIVMMFNPDIQFYQVDGLFHDLGVGPNLDLSEVKEKTILFSGIQYTVKPINSGFLFQAAYPDN
ncbi:hypothetical protein [Bacillus dakarensis]|uniref:hypothetical protein n=1 Tax=Robertmurraya dakarensis TaxID=1926278 RepID=UPI0009816990|nr:hypothetical protein [Bacillus dakarensis]